MKKFESQSRPGYLILSLGCFLREAIEQYRRVPKVAAQLLSELAAQRGCNFRVAESYS